MIRADRARLPDVNVDGVRIKWTHLNDIVVDDLASGDMLLLCEFQEPWDTLTREQKKNLLLVLLSEFA